MRKPSEGVARPMRPADADNVAALIGAVFAAQPVALDPPPSALGVAGRARQ